MLAFLAAHGALHLLGFEDDIPSGFREMRERGVVAVGVGAERSSGGRVIRR